MADSFMSNTNVMRDIYSGVTTNVKEYRESATQLYNVVHNLSTSWVGQDSKAYVDKIQNFKPIVDELGDKIEEFARLVNANADSIDEMVASIASSFKS